MAPTTSTSNDCLLCHESFKTGKMLDTHIKTVHLGMSVCPMCPDFSTLVKLRLKYHLKVVHNIDPNNEENAKQPVEMSVQAATKSSNIESNHVQLGRPNNLTNGAAKISEKNFFNSDEDDSRFECDDCWFISVSKKDLAKHRFANHGDAMYGILDEIQTPIKNPISKCRPEKRSNKREMTTAKSNSSPTEQEKESIAAKKTRTNFEAQSVLIQDAKIKKRDDQVRSENSNDSSDSKLNEIQNQHSDEDMAMTTTPSTIAKNAEEQTHLYFDMDVVED